MYRVSVEPLKASTTCRHSLAVSPVPSTKDVPGPSPEVTASFVSKRPYRRPSARMPMRKLARSFATLLDIVDAPYTATRSRITWSRETSSGHIQASTVNWRNRSYAA